MFFSILKFWFSGLSVGWKGKKWPKITKNSVCCALYFRNHISYDLHFWCTCMYKRIVSSGILFFFFSKFWFWGSLGGWGMVKGEKWPKKAKNYVCLTLYLRNCTSYDCDLWSIFVKWRYLKQILSFFKIFIFGVFGGVKGQKMT